MRSTACLFSHNFIKTNAEDSALLKRLTEEKSQTSSKLRSDVTSSGSITVNLERLKRRAEGKRSHRWLAGPGAERRLDFHPHADVASSSAVKSDVLWLEKVRSVISRMRNSLQVSLWLEWRRKREMAVLPACRSMAAQVGVPPAGCGTRAQTHCSVFILRAGFTL